MNYTGIDPKYHFKEQPGFGIPGFISLVVLLSSSEATAAGKSTP